MVTKKLSKMGMVLFVPITPLMALRLRYNKSLDTMNFILFYILFQ